ncbi:MAG: [FeFe] hydrogenase H-cluster radical SAM maturase HydE, partial [Candidatus Pacebacteria bacterium]|nr:[FeFe] hydrogenase H-cluster radical SAM maturase HydE [Candidatus Paceibacterota bacterium]
LIEIIKRIKQRCGVLVFMSIGERDFDCYDRMYTAGARGVLLRFETSNPDIYRKIHYSDLNKRIELIEYAVNRGYVVATGSLIGLPEQTEEDLANDILLAKSLKAEMYSFGPLIPTPGTPLSKSKLVDISKVLKFISVARFTDPESKILVTTALETLDKENGSKNGLLAGANSLMINVTPDKYKELYSIYPNKAGNDKKVEDNIEDTLKLLYSLGRAPTDLGM